MENYTKIYPSSIQGLVDRRSLRDSLKGFFVKLLSLGKFISVAILAGGLLLAFQILVVGINDRLGISPKISLIVSSLCFAAVFGGIAIVGGVKRMEKREFPTPVMNGPPICKILIIKRKIQETQI